MQYEHICEACKHEWEESYKMTDPIPQRCPSCKKKGKVKRLISWSSGRVELSGRERASKLWNEGKQIAREAKSDPKKAANLVGEERYHQIQLQKDQYKKEKLIK